MFRLTEFMKFPLTLSDESRGILKSGKTGDGNRCEL